MENKKPYIAIITDNSFKSNAIYAKVPFDNVFEIIKNNQNAKIIYGMNYRVDSQVEFRCNEFKIAKENMVKFSFDKTCKGINIAKKYLEILSYNPSKIYLFRDNKYSSDTALFVNKAIEMNISVININSDGVKETLSNTVNTKNKYFKHSLGRKNSWD